MTRSIYARPDGGWCASCIARGFHYRMTDPQHFHLHVPRDRWPAEMRSVRKERVVVDGKVYDKGSEPTAEPAWKREPFAVPFPTSEYDAFTAMQNLAASIDAANAADTCPVCGLRAFGGADVADCPHVDNFTAVSEGASAPGSLVVLPEAADAGTTADSPSETALTCDCGRVSKSAAGHAAHQRHCEAVVHV